MKLALTFDDVLLIPKYSEITSRSKVDLSTYLTKNPDLKLKIPIISSPMKTVTETQMAQSLADLGSSGVIHRFHDLGDEDNSILLQSKQIAEVNGLVGFAIGVEGKWQKRVEKGVESGGKYVVVDVAHGNHIKQLILLKEFKKLYPTVPVIGANIVDGDAVKRLCDVGVNGIRIGIGGGSLCTTRVMTGFGVPSITSLQWCAEAIKQYNYNVSLIQDGGIRYPSDIVKSLAAGADCVMLGSLLAPCIESASEPVYNSYTRRFEKRYMGSASAAAKGEHRHVEGAEKTVAMGGSVKLVIQNLIEGIQSGFSYNGSFDINHFKATSEFVQITNNGMTESHPHLLFEKS